MIDSSGNFDFAMAGDQGCYFNFTFTGALLDESDVAHPGAATYQTPRPIAFTGAQVYLNDVSLPLSNMTHSSGNQVQQIGDPRAVYGLGEAGIVQRQPGGSFDAPELLKSERDVVASWRDGTEATATFVWGSTAGNRFAVSIRRAIYTGATDQDNSGFGYVSTPYRNNGANEGITICFW
jgi:hypothetical protein